MVAAAAIAAFLLFHTSLDAQSVDRSALKGQELYHAACAACHGTDGRGQPIAVRGFDVDPPDFTDCSLTTAEADLDWLSVIHQGGPARAFDRLMPAFGGCVVAGQSLTFNKSTLRGTIAMNYYRLAHTPRVAVAAGVTK